MRREERIQRNSAPTRPQTHTVHMVKFRTARGFTVNSRYTSYCWKAHTRVSACAFKQGQRTFLPSTRSSDVSNVFILREKIPLELDATTACCCCFFYPCVAVGKQLQVHYRHLLDIVTLLFSYKHLLLLKTQISLYKLHDRHSFEIFMLPLIELYFSVIQISVFAFPTYIYHILTLPDQMPPVSCLFIFLSVLFNPVWPNLTLEIISSFFYFSDFFYGPTIYLYLLCPIMPATFPLTSP